MSGILLDTNVMSERARLRPNFNVEAWFSNQRPDRLFLTTIVIGELAAGVERLPAGRRRAGLQVWLEKVVGTEFAGKILAFDTAAAFKFGRLVAASLAQGRPPSIADAQIAAIAALHDMSVATRDVDGFAPFGVPVLNPWEP